MLSNAEIEFFPTLGQWCTADFLPGETAVICTLLFINVILLLSASVSVGYIAQSALSCFIPSYQSKTLWNTKSSTLTVIVNVLSLAVFSVTTSFSAHSRMNLDCMAVFSAIGAVLLIRWMILRGIGRATGERELCEQMKTLISSNIILGCMISCTAAFVTILFPAAADTVPLVLAVLVLILALNFIIAELRTFIQFRTSFFCSFLYLCTLDLLPVFLAAVYGLSI